MSTVPPNSDKPAPTAQPVEHDALPPGTRFGEFEILRVLGIGGFGIVYLARDHSLERDVALKEYMPASLAARGAGPQITIRSSSFAETYAIGLRSFVNEARLLARFDHASLVKVYRFWEDNATAYMVMPYLQGITLRDARRAMPHPPDEAWIRSVIDPILGALELLHREGVYHRDIAPDNILLPPEGPPVLLDFGAARRVISDRTQSLTAILKPSYAPIEQYAEMTQLRQGPWTDLYALGAVVHYLLFGVPPAPATARAVQADADSIADRSVPGVSPRMLEAVAWALAIHPSKRPQSAEELRGAFDGRVAVPMLGRQHITLPGALVPQVGGAAPAPGTSEFQPTMRVESFSEPIRVDTAHRPIASTANPPIPPAPPPPPAGPRTGSDPVSQPGFEARAAAAAAGAPRTLAPPASMVVPASGAASSSKLGVVLAALALLVVAAGVAVWQFGGRGGAGVVAGPPASAALARIGSAASALANAPPVAATALPAPASAVAPPVPTPTVATATVAPAASGPGRVATAAGASASAAPRVVVAVAASAPSGAASRPKPGTKGKPGETGAPGTTTADRLQVAALNYPAADAHPRPSAAREPTPAPPPRPVVVAEPTGPSSAREVCGGRVFIALAVCMDRECEQPRFRNTAECIPILEMKHKRENN